MWNQQLIEKYNITGPRYTSYPTALQFEEKFGNHQFKLALKELANNEPIALYVHIPFCHSICNYCACNKIITKNKSRAEEYLKYLKLEIERLGKLVGQRPVSSIHWGGGTPTFLTDEQIVRLVQYLEDGFNILRENHEFSIEIDPRTVGPNTLQVLAELGFNRVSIGIQDFDPKVQQAVNRIQPQNQSIAVIQQARDLGFHSVSVDLIYGLPFQTVSSFNDTIEKIIAIKPDRLSLFNYAHLPHRFNPQRRIKNEDLPCAREKLIIFENSIDQLTNAGYCYIGMDHFALPEDDLSLAQKNNTLHRNFQGYTTQKENVLLGIGMSAISQIGGIFSQNQRDLYEYYEALDNGDLAIWRGCVSEPDDVLRAAVIQQLICHFELTFSDINEAFGINFKQYFAEELADIETLVADGLVIIDDEKIRVQEVGRLLIRNVCMIFDAYLSALATGNQYSQAI